MTMTIMVINEGGTMRTSSILVKSLTKTLTRTKVADPVAFAPGGLSTKLNHLDHNVILSYDQNTSSWKMDNGVKLMKLCSSTWSLSRKPSFQESHPRSFSQFVWKGCKHTDQYHVMYSNQRGQTSQELRMQSSVTINFSVTKIVMNSGSQLSVL